MKHLKIFILIAIIAMGCTNNAGKKAVETYSYTDDYGSVVEVPKEPKRVVSLSPAVTEIMFAIGADSLLVGRTEFCSYPPEAASIENIGGISNLNIEKVLSMNPDLIISGSMVPQKVVQQFEKMGVPMVCVIEKPAFDELFANISKIGGLVGMSAKADSLNKKLKEEMANLELSDGSADGPSCYYVVGFGSGGNFTAGGNTFINDIITMAGGHNIAAGSVGWTFSLEVLMEEDPDYILIRAEDSARFCNTDPYKQLTAVKEKRMIALEDGILDLQVPRNIEAIRRLHTIFGGQKR
jgi:iron complex transport system substrate-binding protein